MHTSHAASHLILHSALFRTGSPMDSGPRALLPVLCQFSYVQFATFKLKSPRGWAHFSRSNFWKPAVPSSVIGPTADAAGSIRGPKDRAPEIDTADIIHVRVLLSFQQPTFQPFTQMGIDIQMPCVFETCSYFLLQAAIWNVGCWNDC